MVTFGSPMDYVQLKLHRKYYVFVPLMRNPLPSKASHFQFTISLLCYIVGENHAPWYGFSDGLRDFFHSDRKNERT